MVSDCILQSPQIKDTHTQFSSIIYMRVKQMPMQVILPEINIQDLLTAGQ